jgi:hypothetical protein
VTKTNRQCRGSSFGYGERSDAVPFVQARVRALQQAVDPLHDPRLKFARIDDILLVAQSSLLLGAPVHPQGIQYGIGEGQDAVRGDVQGDSKFSSLCPVEGQILRRGQVVSGLSGLQQLCLDFLHAVAVMREELVLRCNRQQCLDRKQRTKQ